MKHKSEAGKTMPEILAVLAIMGVLSVSALMGIRHLMNKHKVNEIINAVNQANVQISADLAQNKIESSEAMSALLERYATTAAGYNISFKGPKDGDKEYVSTEFVAEITDKNGKRIKGAICRQIVTSMLQMQDVSDIDFTVNDEEMEDGSKESVVAMRLSGKAVDLTALCGKDVF